MSYKDISRWASEQAGKQAQTTYEDYNKIKGFEDVGYLLQDYVISGGEVSANTIRNNQIDVAEIVVSLNGDVMKREGVSFITVTPNTTYYLDFTKDGDWHWTTAHAPGIANEDYLTIAEITSNGQSLISSITDKRGRVGGTRFKDEFGLEDYAKRDEVASQLADTVEQIEALDDVKANKSDVDQLAIDKANQTDLTFTNSIAVDAQSKANDPIQQIGDNTVSSRKLKKSTNADKIQPDNLSTETLAIITGQSPAGTIPAVGSVTKEILANEAATTEKRSVLGEMAMMLNAVPVNFVWELGKVTVSFSNPSNVMWRNSYYDVPQSILIINYGADSRTYYRMFFHTKTNTLKAYHNGNINTVTQDEVLIASLKIEAPRLYVSMNGAYTINGMTVFKDESIGSQSRSTLGELAMFEVFTGKPLDVNFTTRKITVSQGTRFYNRNRNFDLTANVTLDIDAGWESFAVFYDTKTRTLACKGYSNYAQTGETEFLVGVGSTNGQHFSAIGSYTINGANQSLNSAIAHIVPNLDFGLPDINSTTQIMTIPADTTIFYQGTRWNTGSTAQTINLSLIGSTVKKLYFDTLANTLHVRAYDVAVPVNFLLLGVLRLVGSQVSSSLSCDISIDGVIATKSTSTSSAHIVPNFAMELPNIVSTTQKITFPADTSVFWGSNRWNTGDNPVTLDLSVVGSTVKRICLLPNTGLKVYQLNDKIPNNAVLLGVIRLIGGRYASTLSCGITVDGLGKSEDVVVNYKDAHVRAIGHRGFLSQAPENTIAGLHMAAKKGFQIVELDVVWTYDGVPVILHDDTINRTGRNMDGSQIAETLAIKDMTYAQTQQYDFGIWFSEKYKGTKLSTFEEYMLECKKLNLNPSIEIKVPVTLDRLQILVDTLKKIRMLRHCSWVSFYHDQLIALLTLDPYAEVGFTNEGLTSEFIQYVGGLKTDKNKLFIPTTSNGLTKELIAEASLLDVQIDAWTIDDPVLAVKLANMGVGGFTTNGLNIAEILVGV